MGKGEKRRRDAMGVRPTPGTMSRVLAWADAHSIDVSNDEADDLVRRLRAAHSSDSDGGGQHPTPSRGIPDTPSPDDDDRAPGMAVGEDVGRPIRYDYLYASPVAVTVGGERAVALHPPFDGRVRLRPVGEKARAVLVALDELSEDDRTALARAPVRRRIEAHVRCSVRGCAQAYRAWLSASGDEIAVEDTAGERICGSAGLFAARCGAHRRERRDGRS